MDTKTYIAKVKETHKNKYDYSKLEFDGWNKLVKIICPKHGPFEQTANNHLNHGCRKCAWEENGKKRKSSTFEKFYKKVPEQFHKAYKYKQEEIPVTGKITILCKKHNEIFQQRSKDHLNGKTGCGSCKLEKGKQNFLDQIKDIHGNKYDYSEMKWKGFAHKIKILCKVHGPFIQRANSHWEGHGCPKCVEKRGRSIMSIEEWIEKAKQIHGDTYDYSKAKYKGSKETITVICKKHGSFKVKASDHIYSRRGCPKNHD